MKKLALKLEELRVESFETVDTGDRERGTIAAREETGKSDCWSCVCTSTEQTREYSCQSCSTCKECTETCGFTICLPF